MTVKTILSILLFIAPFFVMAQDEERDQIPDSIPFSIDSLYREDQFYAGFHFNLVTNRPSDISQESFSGGVNLGFIRDFPFK